MGIIQYSASLINNKNAWYVFSNPKYQIWSLLKLMWTIFIWNPNCRLNDRPSNLLTRSHVEVLRVPSRLIVTPTEEMFCHMERPGDGTSDPYSYTLVKEYSIFGSWSMIISLFAQGICSYMRHKLIVYFTQCCRNTSLDHGTIYIIISWTILYQHLFLF